MAGVVQIPIFPPTLSESHARIARLRDELDRFAASYAERDRQLAVATLTMMEGRRDNETLRERVRELEEEVQFFQGGCARASTRAETVESILRELEGCARYTDRALAAVRGPEDTLSLVYELGSLALLRLAKAPAPSHPRFLLEEVVAKVQAKPVRGADPESGVQDEDAVGASAAVAAAGLPKGCDQGHECDAHSRARDHEDRRISAGVAGHG